MGRGQTARGRVLIMDKDAAFMEKIRSISFPRSSSGQDRPSADKNKTERELSGQLNSGELSTVSADAMAAIGGLCKGDEGPGPQRGNL